MSSKLISNSNQQSYGTIQDDDYESVDVVGSSAISVRNLGFRYKKDVPVLKTMDMTVQQGTIYGLLGASGAGKTTLLKCLVGRLTPKEGECLVLGASPHSKGHEIPGSDVAYAPQEIALYMELTIQQNLEFAGKIHHMLPEDFQQRSKELCDFLEIPPLDRVVSTLSGGQQRRVSLAVALLHAPKLLICDEPTVSLDVVLAQKVWKLFRELAQSGTTVVVTTHYIEEARKADSVGLMRDGRLLAEGNPEDLIVEFGCETLEEVFLELCRGIQHKENGGGKKKKKEAAVEYVEVEEPKTTQSSSLSSKHDSELFSNPHVRSLQDWRTSRVIFAIAKRKLQVLFTMKFTTLFVMLIPAINIALFCSAIGGDPRDLPFVFVNDDQGLGELHYGDAIWKSMTKNHSDVLNAMEKTSIDDALSLIKQGKAWGALKVGANFTKGLFEIGIDLNKLKDQQVANWIQVDLYSDNSNEQITLMIEQTLGKVLKDVEENIGGAQIAPTSIVHQSKPIYGQADPKFKNFLAPGMFTLLALVFPIFLSSISLLQERVDGTLDRLWASGVRPFEQILGHKLSFLFVLTFQLAFMLLVAFLGYDIPQKGSYFTVCFMCLCLGLTGADIGLLISVISNREFEAFQYGFSVFFPLLTLSGIIWPAESIPAGLSVVSKGMPTLYAAEALRDVMIRGWAFSHFSVWLAFVIVIGMMLLFLAASILALKDRD